MTVQVSPGLVQREIDLSLYVPALSTTNFGLVGTTRKGAFEEIHEIGSLAEYTEKLGVPTTPLGYVAQAYLRQGRLLKVVRVGDGNEAKASGFIPGRSTVIVDEVSDDDDTGDYEATLANPPKQGTLYVTGITSADSSVEDATAWETDIVNGTLTIKEDGVVVGSGTINYTTGAIVLTLTGKNVIGLGADRPKISYVYGSTTGNGMQFVSKTEGTWGDNLTVKFLSMKRKYSDGLPQSFSLGVYENSVLVETMTIDKVADNLPIASIGQDDLIEAFQANSDLSAYVDFVEPAGGHYALIEGQEIALSGGDDGNIDITTADIVGLPGASPTGMQIFANPETVDVNLIAAPYFSAIGNGIYDNVRAITDEDLGDGDGTATPTVAALAHGSIVNDAGTYRLTLKWTSASTLISVDAAFDGDFSGNAEITQGAITESTGAWGTSLTFAGGSEPDTGTDIEMDYHWDAGWAPTFASTVATALITLCEARGDCMALVDPPYGCSSDDVIDFHNGEGDYGSSAQLNSSYAALYWPWHEIYDPYTSARVWIAPSGPASAIIAYNDFISETWSAPAGLQRGKVQNSLDIEVSPDLGKRERLLSSGSTVNAVNPFVKFSSDGIVLYGQKTLSRTPSALDRVNVRRLLLYAEKLLATVARFLVFEPNDEKTWRRFVSLAESVCAPIKARRGLYDFRIICDESTNPPEIIDQNKMVGKILLKPTKTAEVIVVDWTVLSTGAEFTEYV